MKRNSRVINKANCDALERKAFGLRLVKGRETKRFSQVELAKQIGVTSQTLSNIEHGLYWPRVALYIAICRALGNQKMPLF